ncbi:amidase family protein [Malacoplasma iowae]|nr:amidase family protein [Malacoplasma iowae]
MRTLIINAIEDVFKKYDFVLMPGSSSVAPLIDDLNSKKYNDTETDDYLQIANFGGYPSVTVPMGKIDKYPIGINIMGKINEDASVLSFAKYINNKLNGGD